MFVRVATISTFLFFILPFLTSATTIVARINQCNSGSIQCCDSVQSADSTAVTQMVSFLSSLGLAVGNIAGQVGINCVPISMAGGNGNVCSAQPACCTGSGIGSGIFGYISPLFLGCDPINLNL